MSEPTREPSDTAPRSAFHRGFAVFRRLGPAGVLAVIASLLPPLGGILLLAKMDVVGKWLQSHGAEGKAMYAGGFAVLAGFALLPTYASAALGGWAFGFSTGLVLAMIGFVGGALIGYTSGRLASGNRVDAIVAEKPRWKAVRDGLVGGTFLKSLGIVTLVRLPPNSPFAITNLVLASVKVPLAAYILGTAAGMLPRTALVVFLASKLQGELAEKASAKPWWMIPIGIVMLLGVFYILKVVAERALARLVVKPGPAG